MKKLKKLFIVLFVLVCSVYYLLFGSPLVDWRTEKLVEATNNITTETITLEELVPFAWDAVYVFEPYEAEENIAKTLGFYSVEIHESWNDSDNWYYFVKGNRIVANPENSLLGIDLPGNGEGSSIGSLHYGDNVLFEVDKSPMGWTYLKPAKRGTVETFTYNNLKLQISNVHSVRTETYFEDPLDPISYQWDCMIYTYYPGAKCTVLQADMLQQDDGTTHSRWAVQDNRIRYQDYGDARDHWRYITDDTDFVIIEKGVEGIFHIESMNAVLKFEPYRE